ncbi:MAG: hypothetical protein LWW95_06390 [Candidatus Desulfofervidus auxilii]|nr:hypothetical protein [Candidatus Desulfofervidus auxilii]
MKMINSPATFKTCYIAQVKEELNLPVRKAWNREGKQRKVQVPLGLKEYIKKAIKMLMDEKKGEIPSYKEIQKKAFEIYQDTLKTNSEKFFGIFRTKNKEYVRKITEDKSCIC